jgi:hypothetical protein
MDLAFSRRAARSLPDGAQPRLDHDALTALLAELRFPPSSASGSAHDPLIELLTAGPNWRKAVTLQEGCFNPVVMRGGHGGVG